MHRSIVHCFVLSVLVPLARADVVQLACVKDNTLYSDLPLGSVSNGAGQHVFSGATGNGSLRRALLQFDFSSIPAGSVIRSVELRMRITMTIADPFDVSVHRVLESWGEGASLSPGNGGAGTAAEDCDATWIHRFFPGATCASVPWAAPGGSFAAASATASAGLLGTVVTWSGPGLVLDVQGWMDGTLPNEGWLVRHVDELTTITAKRFASRENAIAADRPLLVVDFTPPVGSGFCAPGLPNSVSPTGSVLFENGSLSVSSNDNSLSVQGTPDNFGFFLQAPTIASPVLTFYGGNLCLSGQIARFGVTMAQGNAATQPLDFTGTGIETLVSPGETWYYQWAHRDSTPGGGNISSGLAITWLP